MRCLQVILLWYLNHFRATNITMITLMTPTKAKRRLSENMRERRLSMNLTQTGLSERSGVALSTLRKFEQSGAISVDNLFKLMLVLGGLDEMIEASAPKTSNFGSIDEVLSGKETPKRKRGSRS